MRNTESKGLSAQPEGRVICVPGVLVRHRRDGVGHQCMQNRSRRR